MFNEIYNNALRKNYTERLILVFSVTTQNLVKNSWFVNHTTKSNNNVYLRFPIAKNYNKKYLSSTLYFFSYLSWIIIIQWKE